MTWGHGPSLLLMPGAALVPLFDEVAALLSDEFTVVTVERQATSSPAKATDLPTRSVERQADDAARLVDSLGIAPISIYGHNGGACIALEMVLRHPGLLRGAVLHEPPLVSVLEDPGPAIADLDSALSAAAGGTRAMYEAFVRAQEPTLWEKPSRLRDRLLARAERFLAAEAEVFAGYHPNHERLIASAVPLLLVQGATTAPQHHDANRWVAARTGADLIMIPGGHWSFLDEAGALVEAIRPFLRKVHSA